MGLLPLPVSFPKCQVWGHLLPGGQDPSPPCPALTPACCTCSPKEHRLEVSLHKNSGSILLVSLPPAPSTQRVFSE